MEKSRIKRDFLCEEDDTDATGWRYGLRFAVRRFTLRQSSNVPKEFWLTRGWDRKSPTYVGVAMDYSAWRMK